jgi:ABC-type polysaccharide/polyol phosphate export permease
MAEASHRHYFLRRRALRKRPPQARRFILRHGSETLPAAQALVDNGSSTERQSAPRPSISQIAIALLDRVIAFIALERAIIVRNFRLQTDGHKLAGFSIAIRYFLVVNVHIWGFYALGRAGKTSTSLIVFFTPAFAVYYFYGRVSWVVIPSTIHQIFNKNMNIKWMHLFIADIAWEAARMFAATAICAGFYELFPIRFLGTPLGAINFPLLLLTFVIAGAFGAGFGLVVDAIIERMPLFESVLEGLRWFIFVTSGVYMAYSDLSPSVQYYFWFSPLMAPLEYSRKAFDPTYFVSNLSLAYSAAVSVVLLVMGLAIRHSDRKAMRA